jgi:hypothetical protein
MSRYWFLLPLFALCTTACSSRDNNQQALVCSKQTLQSNEIFHEDWEGCTLSWMTRDGQVVATDTDAIAATRGKVEKLTRRAWGASGTTYSSWLSLVSVPAAGDYCLGAWVRWAGGYTPFFGIRRYTSEQVDLGVDERLIGPSASASGSCSSSVPCSNAPNEYRYYQGTFHSAAAEYLQVFNGLDANSDSIAGDAVSYVDVISITKGACPGAPITIAGHLTAWATSPVGAVIDYVPSAAHGGSGQAIPVKCDPAPGTLFPVGTTTITCKAGSGSSETVTTADAHVLSWHRAGVRSALVVVPGSGATGLDATLARLRGLGLEVTTVTESALDAASAAGRTIVLVAPGVNGATVGSKLVGVRSPVLVLEPTTLDDLGMTGTGADADFGTQVGAGVTIADSSHAIAAGLTGSVAVYSSDGALGWGKPAAAATTIAAVTGATDRAAVFVYARGSQMVSGKAPARRAAFFMTANVGTGMTSAGWALFDAAVTWAGMPDALLVVGSGSLSGSDAATRDHLKWLGFDATVLTDAEVTAADAEGAEAVVVSGSVASATLNNKLAAVRVPVVVMQPTLLSAMGMTGTTLGTDYGTDAGQSLAITMASHLLAGGLNGQPSVTTSGWGKPATAGLTVATVPGISSKATVFGYEVGAQMSSLVAPARRVGVFATSGWALFDAAVRWAVRPSAILITGRSTVDPADTGVRSEIERLGYAVARETAGTTDADLLAKALVVFAGQATNVPSSIITSPVPVLSTQGGCLGPLKMTSSVGTTVSDRQIQVSNATHPLAAGLSGRVLVGADSAPLNWGATGGTAAVVATEPLNSAHALIFGYEGGGSLVGGDQVPGRRVGWFASDAMFVRLNPTGWGLFDAAVLWAGGWKVPTVSGQGTPCPGMFCDDFEVGNASRWSLRRDALASDYAVVMDGSHVYRQSDPSAGWRVSQAGAFWGDQVVEARLKVSSFGGSNSGFMAALYGRFDLRAEQSCGYYVALRADGNLALRKVAGGVDSDLGVPVSAGIAAGRWYSLRLEIVGTTLRAYLNGVLMTTQTDSSCAAGGVAVGSQGAVFEVDDVLVSPPSQLTNIALTLPAGVQLGDFTVGANGALRLADRVTVKNTDGAGAAVINGGLTESNIGVEAVVGNLTSVVGVTLRDRAAVWGNLTTAGALTRGNDTTITGTASSNASLGASTVQPWAVSMPVATMGDVVVPPDTPRVLAPGAYGSVVVAYSRSTLSLSSGAYYMDSLDIEPQAILNLDTSAGPIVMYVRGSVIFRGQMVNVAGPASDFLIVSFGTGYVTLESPFTGSILVPNGTLYMNTATGGYRGAFYAQTMQINPDNSIVTLQFPWYRLTSACSGQDAMPRPMGSLCREAVGACDVAEKCDGTLFTCPADQIIPNGSPCDDGSLCTPTDTCQAGVCNGTGAPACDPIDQCHDHGTCNPLTGVCSTPVKADGSACSDGNACSLTDTCQAGACVGGNFKACVASDQCHTPGCDPATGECTNTVKADGSSCNDGVACTRADVCTGGVCGGSDYSCAAPDQCHEAATCNGDGTCSYAAKANGTACNDGNPCTVVDTCQNGVCAAGSPVTCTASDSCHDAGACDSATGQCSNPAKANGSTCGAGQICNGGACAAGCWISGTYYASGTVNGACQSCQPSVSTTSWSNIAEGTGCGTGMYCHGGACAAGCWIDSTYYAANALNSSNTCQSCLPSVSPTAWSSLATGTSCSDGNACTTGETCLAGACQGGTVNACSGHGTCNPSTGVCSCNSGFGGSDCATCSAPGAPTGLAAAAGAGQVALSWTAPTGGAISYIILRSTTKGSGYTQIGTSTTTSYTDTGLTNGVPYYYVVDASNGTNCVSGNSGEAVCGGGSSCDDFQDGTSTSSPAGLAWTSASGYSVTTDSANSSNNVYHFSGAVSAASLISAPNDHTVQARVRITSFGALTSPHRIGIVGRYPSGNSNGSLALALEGATTPNVLQIRVGTAMVTGCSYTVPGNIQLNQWYTLKMVISGGASPTVDGYLDGVKVISSTNCKPTAINTSGSAGVSVRSGGSTVVADFDDVLVY